MAKNTDLSELIGDLIKEENLEKDIEETVKEELNQEVNDLGEKTCEDIVDKDHETTYLYREINSRIKTLKSFLEEKPIKNYSTDNISGLYHRFKGENKEGEYNLFENYRNFREKIIEDKNEIDKEKIIEKAFKIISQVLSLMRRYVLGIEKKDSATILITFTLDNVNDNYLMVLDEAEIDYIKFQETKETFIDEKTGEVIDKIDKSIHYALGELKKQKKYKKNVNKSFVKHYQDSVKYLQDKSKIITGKDKNGKEYSKKVVSKGHVAEAFLRHLEWGAHGSQWLSDTTDKKKVFDDSCHVGSYTFHQLLLISLYYSTGNDAWWTGGDVGKYQAKAGNDKLASEYSVETIANELVNFWEKYKKSEGNSKAIMQKRFQEIFFRKQKEVDFKSALQDFAKKAKDGIIDDWEKAHFK